MSHGYKLRFDQMREGDPTSSDSIPKNETEEIYQSPSHARNVCFVWSNGKRLFLNYSYLVSGEFNPNEEKNNITLIFSSDTIQLFGFNLESLYNAFMEHLPRFIYMTDSRYILSSETKEAVIIEIIVEKKES